MATTLKASSTKTAPAGLTQPASSVGGWTRNGAGLVFKGADCGSDGSANSSVSGLNCGISKTRLGIWAYGPLAAQTISGTLCVTVRGACGTFTNLEHPATSVYIAKPCGTIRHKVSCGVKFPACTYTTVDTDFTFSVTIVACATASAGDYLVLEAGMNDTCFLCSATGHITQGSAGPHTRWVFSGTIALQTSVPNQLMMQGVGI